jgi:transposase-like protein
MEAHQRSKSGRRYDAELKENAVNLVQAGRSFKQVAEDLGVSAWSLRMWVKRSRNGQELDRRRAATVLSPQELENRRLRQQVEYLQRQRDILKKALAIVSDGHLNSASNS